MEHSAPPPLGPKKNHGTSWAKKKSCNLLAQIKNKQPLGTKKSHNLLVQKQNHITSKHKQKLGNLSAHKKIMQSGQSGKSGKSGLLGQSGQSGQSKPIGVNLNQSGQFKPIRAI